jgi:uncharacterized protein (TIGR03118 family)
MRALTHQLVTAGLAALLLASGSPAGAARGYNQTNLVADTSGAAAGLDANLLNAWGVAFDPAGGGTFWVATNHSGLATAYTSAGQPTGSPVVIPAAGGAGTGSPTGAVFNGTADFHGDRFLVCTEDGLIAGWREGAATATVEADNSAAGAVCKGLALGSNAMGNFLFATNFFAATVDVFDKDFHPATLPGGFTDPKVPAGFAPFGIQLIGGKLYVTYAKQDADKHDDVKGEGNGLVDVFDTDGRLVRRFASGSAAGGKLMQLNSPWAVTLAPARFGAFAKMLLVGNFGSGQIVAFPRRGGHPRGLVRDAHRATIVIDGLWSLAFPPGGAAGAPELFFTAGPDDENHGLLGTLAPARARR